MKMFINAKKLVTTYLTMSTMRGVGLLSKFLYVAHKI